MKLEISSPAFANGERIPTKYTADGPDLTPPLAWKGTPGGTKAYALIVDDPDAPFGTWVHWVVYDIPSHVTSLPEGIGKGAKLPEGAVEGKNSWNKSSWGGAAPPPGKPHRYFFRFFALSASTGLKPGATKEQLLGAIKRTTLAEAQCVGLYGR